MRLIFFLLTALGTVEALAWWWTHPAPSGLGQPVLTWRPTPPPPNSPLGANPRVTPLPGLVEKSIPLLHCTSGNARMLETDDSITVHMAMFEWDAADGRASVLEAFKHPPEACLGYMGMELTSSGPDRICHLGPESIAFANSAFRDSAGARVQSFKGIWFPGAAGLRVHPGQTHSGSYQRLVRWQAALHRFRPSKAFVIQGAVRGASGPDDAWSIFQDAMLKDLSMQLR